MENWITEASWIRTGIFFTGFTLFSFIGIVFRYRKKDNYRLSINFHNFSLIVINALMQKALGPLTLLSLSVFLEEKNIGVFNIVGLNSYFEFFITIVFFDLIIYTQHVLTHRIPLLWKLHRVHHTDIGFDTSTALRFHPLETLLSLGVKAFFVVLTGASPLAIFVFEALINFAALFHHSNFSLPKKIEVRVVK